MMKEAGTPEMRLSEAERVAAGRLMQAILSAFSFGALETDDRGRRPT